MGFIGMQMCQLRNVDLGVSGLECRELECWEWECRDQNASRSARRRSAGSECESECRDWSIEQGIRIRLFRIPNEARAMREGHSDGEGEEKGQGEEGESRK